MEEKITYIIGAGASAHAHQLARTPQEQNRYALRLIDFVTELEAKHPIGVFDNLKKVAKNCLEFGSPDTYAKYLYEREPTNDYYRLLKALISFYFETAEFSPDRLNNPDARSIDSRVLPFLTYIAKDNKLAENVKILSWNYDRQFEIAADKYRLKAKSKDPFPGFSVWPNIGDGIDTKKLPFLLHLNGVAGFKYEQNCFNAVDQIAHKDEWIFDFNVKEPLISYAWEDDENGHHLFKAKRKSIAKEMVEGTTILIVIGYSYPFFNRHTDNQLFNSMRKTLRKIYFQDFNSGEFLYNQFNLKKSIDTGDPFLPVVEIVHINNLNNYFVPFEL